MTNNELPATEEGVRPSFFSLPLEIRLEVYDIYFSRDIYHASEYRDGKFGFSFYNLLFANRQIYDEAKEIARRQYMAQLQNHRHVFALYQNCIADENGKFNCSWELGSVVKYLPKSPSPESLAALGLPMLALNVFPQCDEVIEPMDALSQLCTRLHIAISKKGATKCLWLVFIAGKGRHEVIRFLESMFVLLRPENTYYVVVVVPVYIRYYIRAWLLRMGSKAILDFYEVWQWSWQRKIV